MNEETGSPNTPEASEPLGATAAPATEGVETTEAQDLFSSSEGMVSFGAGVLVVTYLLFGLILNDYWVGWIALLFSVFALLLPRGNRAFIEQIAPLPVLMKVIGYSIGLVGLFAAVENLRFASSQLDSFIEIIGALAAYAGYAIAFLGARSIKT